MEICCIIYQQTVIGVNTRHMLAVHLYDGYAATVQPELSEIQVLTY